MKDLILAILNIFKHTGSVITFVRNFFLNTMLLVGLLALIIVLIPKKAAHIPSNSILRLDISGDIVEEKKILGSLESFLGSSLNPESPEPETVFQDILDIIDEAKDDDRISTILLNIKDMDSSGLNQLQTIGQALLDFRKEGKSVVAAEDFYSQSQYYLATYADKIILNSMGGVDLHGFGVYRLYFKEAMEKLAINYNIFKVGTYKSALEPFTRDSMSEEDRKQTEIWLSALWKVYTDDISQQRKISIETIASYTNNIAEVLQTTGGDTAQLALKTGLVDQIWSRQEITDYLKTLTKSSADKPHVISSSEYLAAISPAYSLESSSTNKVGLIIAEGNILPGKQPPGFIGGESLAALIRQAKEDKQVKALVIRINSGGGSAFASEIIRQELLALRKKGKPFIVSMGAVAASGGYWIAADADQIWASEATLTGSIGIFGAIPTFEKTLHSLGIRSDGTGTTPLSAGIDLTQPLPEQLKNAIQQAVSYNYNQFLEIVSKGRKIEQSKVRELAEGRVYDGRSAKTLGLVDNLGTLDEAIDAAAKLAGIIDYDTEYIRPPASPKEQFWHFLSSTLSAHLINKSEDHPMMGKIKKLVQSKINKYLYLDDPLGVYAHSLLLLPQ